MTELIDLLTSPAHWVFGLIETILVDGILLGVCYPLLRRLLTGIIERRVEREHAVLDAEHGFTHDDRLTNGVSADPGDSPSATDVR